MSAEKQKSGPGRFLVSHTLGGSLSASAVSLAIAALSLFSAFFNVSPACAQYYVRGQDPSGIRWQQIETGHFRIIFPEDYAGRAHYVADILEYSYVPVSASLGHQPRKVPVILHNQTVVPNGFVSWAPARLEMFSNPPPGNDTHGWLERLAVHELRHVVQIDKLNQGVTGFFSRVFGEHATGVSLGLFMPLWLLEGDAVAVETALTHGGRGRQPSFEQGLRAQVLEKEVYPYDKAMLGSLKDHVPSHYELGYQLVASARAAYGADIWDKVITNIARRPYTLLTMSNGLRKHAGLSIDEHYDNTFQMLDSAWTAQAESHEYTPCQPVNRSKKLYTHYRPMAFLNDTTLVTLKTGMGDIPRVISLGLDGNEEVLFTPGFYNSEVFSRGGDIIAWSEIRVDPRWEHRSWSEIHTYDIATGIKRRVTRATRFFSPAVSPDGKKIAVTEVTARDEYSLVVIDAVTGETVYKYFTPRNAYLMHPQWHPGGNHLIVIAQDGSGKRLLSVEPEKEIVSTLFYSGHTDISRPRYLRPGKIVFNGAFSGVDNVYILDEAGGTVGRLISSRFGAADALFHEDGDLLVWSDYTAMGYRAVHHQGPWPEARPLEEVEDHSVAFYRTLADQEGVIVAERNIARHHHAVFDYKKGRHLFNFHSWGPFTINVDNMEASPGLSFFSQNALSTSVAAVGYAWDVNERLGEYYVNYSYAGRYPVLDIVAESGQRRSYYREQDDPDELKPFLWRESSLKLGISIPLRYRRGPLFFGITPSVRLGITRAGTVRDAPGFFVPHNVAPTEYRVLAYRQKRSVLRDIRPRWAQAIDLQYRHTPFAGSDMGSVFAGRITGLFPGIARHHSLRLSAAYQEHDRGEHKTGTIRYTFPTLINYPRGITGRVDERTYSFSADYAFPLAYPEWTIAPVIYLKRLHLNMFADYARATRRVTPEEGRPYLKEEDLFSAGVDLVGKVHFLRFFAPVDMGVRAIYLPDEGDMLFRLLFTFQI